MSPDWAAQATSVPYEEFGDPQSLNLCSYVRNSPVVRVDADGHQINDFNNMGFQNGLDEWGDGNWNGRMGEGYQPEGGGQPSAGSKSSSQVKNLNVTSNFSLTTEEQYVIESVFREANIQIHFVDAKKAQVTIINKELNETYTGDISKLKLGEAAPGAKYVYVDLKAVVTVANSPAVRSMAHVSYDAAVGRVIAHELA